VVRVLTLHDRAALPGRERWCAVTSRYVLLLTDDQGGPVAVGPFASVAATERWEQRWPHLADDVLGIVRLVGASAPLSEVGVPSQ
jgi:hypothetical protein